MRTAVTLTAFAVAAAATFGVAYGAGTVFDPINDDSTTTHHAAHHGKHDEHKGGDGGKGEHGAHAGHGAESPGGLQISEGGYTLDLRTPRLEAGRKAPLRFAVVDARTDEPLKDYRVEHGKQLHLIIAARDLVTYRHLHPKLSEDGVWSTDVDLPEAGDYRIFADFKPDTADAAPLTLGADLAVGGEYDPRPLPEPSTTATVGDYTVTLKGDLTAGEPADLTFSVEKDGRPVKDLQPYLGAYGHLVALRGGDLAYLHVHPNGEPGDGVTPPGPEVSFTATAPSSAAYRLFLDFQHEDEVRTAAFTLRAGSAGGAAAPDSAEGPGSGGHSDEHGSGGHSH